MIPTFSIITAVRNGLTDLKRTYISLLHQTQQDFEWIVIDSASTDGTANWLSGISTFPNRMQWISEPDQGISDAWNKAIALARGSQVLILNAGDTYDTDLVERFSSVVNDKQITCCHARLLTESGSPVGIFNASPAKLWRGMHVPHNWRSVPIHFYDQLGGYQLVRHSMDFDWFHRYYLQRGTAGFLIIDSALGDYRLGGHSDINFRDSFIANEKIMNANGTPRLLASFIRRIYTARHLWMQYKAL